MDETTAKQSKDDPNTSRSFEDMLEENPDIACIFSEAIVTIEERGLSAKTIREVNPVAYNADLQAKFNVYRTSFNSASTREQFLQDTTTSGQELHSLESRYVSKERVDLTRDICSDDFKMLYNFRFMDEVFVIPSIKTERLPYYASMFRNIYDICLDQLDANAKLRFRTIDRDATRAALGTIAERCVRQFARDAGRRSLMIDMASTLILNFLVRSDTQSTAAFIKENPTIDDPLEDGMYIRLDREIPEHRSTMIQPESVGVELRTTYNLDFNTMRAIVHYMFSGNSTQRLEGKIKALSTSRGDVRNDIALNCEKVLIHSIREHFLTRREILELMFHHYDTGQKTYGYRCPTCQTVVKACDNTFVHCKCAIVQWLIDTFSYEYDSTRRVMSIPPLGYVKPGVAHYARQAFNLKCQLEATPFVAKTRDEMVIYRVTSSGQPEKMAHQGVKTVRLNTEQPSSSKR